MKKRKKASAVYKRKRKIIFKKRLKQASISLLSVILFMVVLSVIYAFRQHDFFSITMIRLFVNQQYIDTTKLKELISQKISGNFFTLSLAPIVNTLLTDDQIKAVRIRRLWPNELSIYITGYEPVAFFNKDKVITAEGHTFKTPPHLKLISAAYVQGPESQAIQIMQQLYLFNKILEPLNLKIKKFVLDHDLYSMTLSNGLHLTLGNHDCNQRLDRFVKLYASIIGHCEDNIVSIDLRYSNGLAVKWKDQKKCTGS